MKLEREFKEVFDFYSKGDESKDKRIDFEEVAVMVNKMNIQMTDEDLKSIISSINPSEMDKVSYKTFVELFDKKLYKEVKKTDAIEAFELFDKDKTGKILIEDFQHVMHNLCDDLDKLEVEEFLTLANQNNDGYIHYKEFVDFMKS